MKGDQILRTSLVVLFLLATLVLSACSGQSTEVVQPVSTAERVKLDIPTCSSVSVSPPVDPTLQALVPPVSDEDWTLGKPDAAITALVYSDFECPYCSLLDPVLDQLYEKYPEDVRLVYRYFPMSYHAHARLAAQAAEAAGRQGKFFEMKTHIFAAQETWAALEEEPFKAWLQAAAGTLGLDVDKFTKEMLSQDVADKVEAAYQSAMKSGIPGTPFLFINGQVYQAQSSLATLESYVKLLKTQYKECPPFSIDPTAKYVATLETTKGNLVLQLYPAKAPVTVNNFIFLAREGWYKENVFTIQETTAAFTGDPTNTGLGNPGFFYDMEPNDLKFDKAGMVGLFNQGPNSGGSMFFITLKEVPDIDGRYTVFGQVINGMEVLTQLANADTLKDVTIEEK